MLANSLNVFAQATEYLQEWKEGHLDSHMIATGRGDAALIVMPDGTSMMIDAGDNAKAKDTQHPDNTKKPGEWQAIYMKHFMAQLSDKEHLDYALLPTFTTTTSARRRTRSPARMATRFRESPSWASRFISTSCLTGHIPTMTFRPGRMS